MNNTSAPAKGLPLTMALEDVSRLDVPGRLVVIVPDVAETAQLASRIHQVAHGRKQDVLIIGIASQFLSEDELRRKLTLLAAFLQDAGTAARVRTTQARDWITTVQSQLGPDDLLACCVDRNLPAAGDQWIEMLAARFRRPVYTFMDPGSLNEPKPHLAARVAPWLCSFGVILAFFWLQIGLSRYGDSPANTIWLLISIPVEIGLVWLCNSAFG